MHEGRTVFAQLMDWLPKYELAKCVKRYRGDFHVRAMSCHEQFLILAFAQLTYRESLRDIETCLRALGTKLYHSGIRSRASRSTLADANEKRDWRIFSDFAHVLIAVFRRRGSLPHSSYTILHILSVTLFAPPILQAFSENQPFSEAPGMQEQPYLPGIGK